MKDEEDFTERTSAVADVLLTARSDKHSSGRNKQTASCVPLILSRMDVSRSREERGERRVHM